MMAEGNGTSVTWRELNLLRETIDERFNGLTADVNEIKWSINLILENKKQRWRSWGPPLVAAVISAAVSFPFALFVR